MKIASACYGFDWIEGHYGLVEKYDAWVSSAAAAGAELLVFPEYAAMELVGLASRASAGDLAASMEAVCDLLPDYWDICAELARRHGVHILAGSGPRRVDGAWVNRAMFLAPDGGRQPHDKQVATPWERELMGIVPGAPLTLMETALGRIGVLICYDCEFPLLARALVEAGAEVLLVPSQTEVAAGYNRVRIGAMARALEGQCVTVQAVTQGRAPWTPILEDNAGAAGIYAPPDRGFPQTGVIAEGEMNRAGWTFGAVDLAALRRVRAEGDVRLLADWPGSVSRTVDVQSVTLA